MPLTVLTGGARSGKSRWAVRLAENAGGPVTMIATAEALDDDMAERIERHQRERPAGWRTIEDPRQLAGAISSVEAGATVIVDCLTLWLSNLVLDGLSEGELLARATDGADAAKAHDGRVIAVTNEVGSGVVPPTELGRRFADLLGLVNQVWVERSDRAALVVAGRLLWLPADGPI
jgi:adenosyl cobinamide kinase/adenosyl cobinamide phosphate guanylyltransferase